jgi:hypothetical protein
MLVAVKAPITKFASSSDVQIFFLSVYQCLFLFDVLAQLLDISFGVIDNSLQLDSESVIVAEHGIRFAQQRFAVFQELVYLFNQQSPLLMLLLLGIDERYQSADAQLDQLVS